MNEHDSDYLDRLQSDHDARRVKCACVHFHADDCWRLRYNLPHGESVRGDGGPCQCLCHDEHDIDVDQP
jgi:hypothetical protein